MASSLVGFVVWLKPQASTGVWCAFGAAWTNSRSFGFASGWHLWEGRICYPTQAKRGLEWGTRLRVGLSALDRYVGGGVFGADVFGSRANQAVVVELFDDVGGPSGDSAYCEDWGK